MMLILFVCLAKDKGGNAPAAGAAAPVGLEFFFLFAGERQKRLNGYAETRHPSLFLLPSMHET